MDGRMGGGGGVSKCRSSIHHSEIPELNCTAGQSPLITYSGVVEDVHPAPLNRCQRNVRCTWEHQPTAHQN